jgi:hypothetical protein
MPTPQVRDFQPDPERGTLAAMPSERTNFGMLIECDGHAKYTGKKRPTCDGKKGCAACWAVHNKYLDAHRPKMSADFKEFWDYIAKHKRMLQAAKSDTMISLSLYEVFKVMDRMIRTGSYRHHMITLDSVLDEMKEIEAKGPKRKLLPSAR